MTIWQGDEDQGAPARVQGAGNSAIGASITAAMGMTPAGFPALAQWDAAVTNRTDGMSERVTQIDSHAAWDCLQSDASAHLIDVRTPAEWASVGVPDLSAIGKDVHFIEWRMLHALDASSFCDEVKRLCGDDPNTPLLFLCRMGGRSHAAAEAMAARGYLRCANISDGYEGHPGADRRRGLQEPGSGGHGSGGSPGTGWKAIGLPCRQP